MKKKIKYEALDAIILEELRYGNKKNILWYKGKVYKEAHYLTIEYEELYKKFPDKIISRRLQSLKNKKLINFCDGEWHILPKKENENV